MFKLGVFNKIMLAINLFTVAAMIIGWTAKHFNGEIFWYVAFMGISLPFLVILNGIFAMYWAIRIKIHVLIPLLAIGLVSSEASRYIQFNDEVETEADIKVLSYNVRVFDLYDWHDGPDTRNEIFQFIKEQEADILCFQEFFNSTKKGYYNTVDTLKRFQKARNSHTEYTNMIGHSLFGIATFSAYPIIKKGQVDLQNSNNNICIYTDIRKGRDTLRIYNMHLASLHIKSVDYKVINDIQSTETEENMKSVGNMITRMRDAFAKRSAQAETIKAHMANSPYPIILAGDFNDTPSSFAYEEIRGPLCDGFMEAGNGMGMSYNGMLNLFRIDYIMYDQQRFTAKNFVTHKNDLSDHFPLTCEFDLHEKNEALETE